MWLPRLDQVGGKATVCALWASMRLSTVARHSVYSAHRANTMIVTVNLPADSVRLDTTRTKSDPLCAQRAVLGTLLLQRGLSHALSAVQANSRIQTAPMLSQEFSRASSKSAAKIK